LGISLPRLLEAVGGVLAHPVLAVEGGEALLSPDAMNAVVGVVEMLRVVDGLL
jgi:hypothetical protein